MTKFFFYFFLTKQAALRLKNPMLPILPARKQSPLLARCVQQNQTRPMKERRADLIDVSDFQHIWGAPNILWW